MNKNTFVFIACSLLVFACKDKQSSFAKDNSKNQKIKNPWFEKFGLPVSADFETDSTTFLFLKSKSFDTSFLLQLEVRDSIVRGVYYEVLPSYHRDIDDYLDTSSKLVAFDGMSFIISFSEWEKITDKAKAISESDSTNIKKEGSCADCPFYFLSYNKRITIVIRANESQFEDYTEFLKNELIYRLKKFRKPRLPGEE